MLTEKQRLIRWHEISAAAKFYGAKCQTCQKSIFQEMKRTKYTRVNFKGFTFHHLVYPANSPKYNLYDDRWRYKSDLVAYLTTHHTEFNFLCQGCHEIVTKCVKKRKREKDFMRNLKKCVDQTLC